MPPPDLLAVRGLTVRFFTYDGVIKALDDVSFSIREREIFGLVGETGCGKSVTAKVILRLIPDPPGRITAGEAMFGGLNLLDSIEDEAKISIGRSGRAKVRRNRRIAKRVEAVMRTIRGKEISMIFQEPSAALNPVLTVQDQIAEAFLTHQVGDICAGLEAAGGHRWLFRQHFRGLREREELRGAFREKFAAASFHRGVKKKAAQATDVLTETAERVIIEELERDLRSLARKLRLADARLDLWRWLWVAGVALGAVVGFSDWSRAYAEGLVRFATPQGASSAAWGAVAVSVVVGAIVFLLFGRLGSRVFRRIVERPIRKEVHKRVIEMLKQVRIPDPETKAQAYPFELSGGMQQRVMIAMALACRPRLLLADEPTTALDVTIQAQILALIRRLRDEYGSSIMLITHDLGVVAETCDRVGVMYAGVVAEIGSTLEIFGRPLHPYAVGLLRSIPETYARTGQLSIIPGSVPSLLTPPEGCRFHPRCPFAADGCKREVPRLYSITPGHSVACHLYDHPESFSPETIAARDGGLVAGWQEVVAP